MKRLLSADEKSSQSLKAFTYIEEIHQSDLTSNNKNYQSEVLNSLDRTQDNSAWNLDPQTNV